MLSVLCIFPPPSAFSLSPDVCERAGARRCVFTCVFANERVQAWFPFEHLFDVAVYLFISPPVKALLRLLGLQRIGCALL